MGLYTFQEAFDKTGRIINITVAPNNNYDPPRLLNYLTAPHVCVWSAAAASCALPGTSSSSSLLSPYDVGIVYVPMFPPCSCCVVDFCVRFRACIMIFISCSTRFLCLNAGIFDSVSLIVKEPNGQFRPENEWTRQGECLLRSGCFCLLCKLFDNDRWYAQIVYMANLS